MPGNAAAALDSDFHGSLADLHGLGIVMKPGYRRAPGNFTFTVSHAERTASCSGESAPKSSLADAAVALANAPNVAFGASEPPVSVSYQIGPARPMRCRRARGREVERPVWDAGIDVDAAVVSVGADIVVHRVRLRILAEDASSYAVPGAFMERSAVPVPGREQALADQPAGLLGLSAPDVLLNERAEYVGHRLV